MVDLSGHHRVVTGASSGIGLAVLKSLLQQKIYVQLIGRNLEKLENSFKCDCSVTFAEYDCLDIADLNKV
ncbi:Short-chain dehydrogenase/reductase [Candidatus Protochlamydia naegleriophila]|uniref:Short-chain dehydrogenase/reductase n=1 Tax=Candidatus Protochlamydia naegleriophila TaxID=389348 RepID=A0A0U5JEU5_9BACT|nr:SDR family NAD(P)-dependent oxidoreductase [Candidatus Protochlamydia naegleriophila]CUI16895.1 Short-chain dehydrogenase/reductase [Candidatus Protochlamydia naegleriophila]